MSRPSKSFLANRPYLHLQYLHLVIPSPLTLLFLYLPVKKKLLLEIYYLQYSKLLKSKALSLLRSS